MTDRNVPLLMTRRGALAAGTAGALGLLAGAARADGPAKPAPDVWPGWRGPTRDATLPPGALPDSLKGLTRRWRVPLQDSYSGPLADAATVYVTETRDRKFEVVSALDRKDGTPRWSRPWLGSMTVILPGWVNGSWIRSTPAIDADALYCCGMRETFVCLDKKDGAIRWTADLLKSRPRKPVPVAPFGGVCSPLVADEAVYVEAGGAFLKLDKSKGTVLWRALEEPSDDSKDRGSFSSPVLATVAGVPQLLVQSRQNLSAVDPAGGAVLWSVPVPNFRGMNICTPTVHEDAVFTSVYQQGSFLFRPSVDAAGKWTVKQVWRGKTRGYMSSPVVVGGHAYLHNQDNRFVCLDLTSGEATYTTSKKFDKYMSLLAAGDKILGLNNRGRLLLIKADPRQFTLLDEKAVSDQETWAHLGVAGRDVLVREQKGMAVWSWA